MLVEEGVMEKNGDMPVNLSGGSLGAGYTFEMTGLQRVLEVVLQLRGEAGKRQVSDAETGLAQCWRGIPTTSGAVAVLSTKREGM
jgi:acetyl-CoA C-acetyltransferase